MLQTCERIIKLWDALVIFYHGFLEDDDKKKHQINTNLNDKQRAAVQSVHVSLAQSKAKKSIPGKARLDKILNLLFDKRKVTPIVLHTLASCLDKIEHFLKKFPAHKPMAYTAHSEIFCVLKLFAECFILNDHIPTLKANDLAKLKYTERSAGAPPSRIG